MSYNDNPVAIHDSVVSKEAQQVRFAGNTVLQECWLQRHRPAVLAHLKRVSDFLEHGWWEARGKEVVFLDGKQEPETRSGPALGNFVDQSFHGTEKKIMETWERIKDSNSNPLWNTVTMVTEPDSEMPRNGDDHDDHAVRPCKSRKSALPKHMTGRTKRRR